MTVTAAEYFCCAACFDTPNIVPISDQLRSAWRGEDCCRDCIINLIAPVGETSNRAEGPGVDNLQVA